MYVNGGSVLATAVYPRFWEYMCDDCLFCMLQKYDEDIIRRPASRGFKGPFDDDEVSYVLNIPLELKGRKDSFHQTASEPLC